MLEYNKYSFNIVLDKKIKFHTLPSFIFRNNIGFHLRKITCAFKDKECYGCVLKSDCVYSTVFETTLDKNNEVLKGRNNAPHPYMIRGDIPADEPLDRLVLDIVLIGTAVKHFPYFLLSMLNIGKSGILKEKVGFKIEDVYCRGESVMNKTGCIHEGQNSSMWDYHRTDGVEGSADTGVSRPYVWQEKIKVNFETQVRIQRNGKYLRCIAYKDFLYASARRIILLESFFGNGGADLEDKFGERFIESASEGKKFDADLKWTDYRRYSARQKQSMMLGGLVGTALVSGSFSEAEFSLIRAAELFGVGKNVSFGLGRIKAEVS